MSKLTEEAAQHHTDLNMFHAVMVLMESGLLYSPRAKEAAHKIITICKREASIALRQYDAALQNKDESNDA